MHAVEYSSQLCTQSLNNSFKVTYISHNWDKTWCTNIIILNEQNVLKPHMHSLNTKIIQLTQQLMLHCTLQYPSASLMLVDSTFLHIWVIFYSFIAESDVSAPHDRLESGTILSCIPCMLLSFMALSLAVTSFKQGHFLFTVNSEWHYWRQIK